MSATFPETTQSRQSTAQVEQPDAAGIADFVRFRDLTRERLETPDPIKATPLHERAFRLLSRRSPVALAVTGFEGVGRTGFVSELAGLCAAGQGLCGSPRRYVLFDVRHVPEEDSRFCLEAILARCARQPDLLPCLAGLSRLLRPAQQDAVRACLQAFLSRPERRLIGLFTPQEYQETIARDADLSRHFARLDLPEPPEDIAVQKVAAEARRLEADYSLSIPLDVIRRTVSLSTHFILSEHLPAKAIRVLRNACDDHDFARRRPQTAKAVGCDRVRAAAPHPANRKADHGRVEVADCLSATGRA